MTNKQALREAAEKAGAEVWCAFIDTKSKTYAVHTPDDDRCGDVVKWPGLDGQQRAAAKARFIAAANPATVLALLDELEAAEKRIADLEAVKCKFSDSKLLSLAKDIVENLVDTGGSDPEYTKQYVDWTCKRIRAAGRINGED